MDLSIVIVNFNTKDLTVGCVKSVNSSKPKVRYEIIVVDNGSTDDSVPTLKKLGVKLIENTENLGFARANNQGIRAAKGKYILLLNSDTKALPGAIDTLYQFAQENSDAGAVVPKLLNPDKTPQPSAMRLPSLWSAIKKYWFNAGGHLDKFVPDTSVVDAAVMAAFLITPKARQKIGLLDERYFMYFEDLDYCRRLRNAGLKIYYVPDSEFVHYHGASGKDLADDKNQWRRLIPSSTIYHGRLKHYLIYLTMLLGQKFGIFLLLIPLILLPVYWNLLRPGFFPMQDDLQAFRVHQMDKCLDDLQVPCRWVPDAGYQFGYPQFNFYPPAPYYLGALLHRTGLQYIDSVKILFILGYILSAYAIYLLVAELTDKSSGFVGALLYTYIPYKAVEVYVRGALSEFWAQIFFPLILWAIYKLIKTDKLKFALLLAVFSALLATTHTLMAMIFVPVAGLWAVFWLVKEKWSGVRKLTLGVILGFGLSAFFTLPVLLERKFVHTEGILSGYFDYRQHFVSLYKLFLSNEWGYGSSGFPDEKLNLSLGIIQWVVGLIVAPLLALLTYKKNKTLSLLTFAVGLTALGSIFMMHMKSSFIWAQLPFLWYLQFPWRFLAVSIFFLCLSAGLAVYFAGRFKYILGLGLVVASAVFYVSFFTPKAWLNITDAEKFSGQSWEKQLTISIFDYLPIYGVLPPWAKAPDTPEVLEGEAKFLDYKKGSNYQEGTIVVLKDARLRLPLFDFPGMVVTVDGGKVEHVNNDCTGERYCRGLITVEVPAGKHELLVRLTDTPIRRVGNYISLAAIMVIVGLIVARKNEKISP